jgi:hypothetical protein
VSAALFIVLNAADPGFEVFVNGKALSRHEAVLAELALEVGAKPLMEFFSASADALGDLDEEAGLSPEELGAAMPETWFAPEDGLSTVRAMLAQPAGRLPAGVAEELREFERVLSSAAERQLKWHLSVDY